MRTSCSIWETVLALALRDWFHRQSSVPQRTCRPMAMPIMFTGSTLRTLLSTVSTAPSGTARTKWARL
ncbi:hypothetical protein GY15_30230 [Delftia sp. 670]|nr:hypothetical protein GY14_24355 [Delftia tsuruhatensis]KEH10764.1 hypothetical protein GY15_30230 [Delftia sp. 670]